MKKMLALCPLAILLMVGKNGVAMAAEQQTIEQHEGEWVYPAAETTNSESLLEQAIQQRILRRDDIDIDTGAKQTNTKKREKKLKLKNNDNDTESTTSKSSKRGKKRRGKSGKSSKSAKSTDSPTENPTVFP